MAQWLKQCRVDTGVMESTAVYWFPIFQVLQGQGIEVLRVDARHVNYVPGRKTDVGAIYRTLLSTAGCAAAWGRPRP